MHLFIMTIALVNCRFQIEGNYWYLFFAELFASKKITQIEIITSKGNQQDGKMIAMEILECTCITSETFSQKSELNLGMDFHFSAR